MIVTVALTRCRQHVIDDRLFTANLTPSQATLTDGEY